MDTLVRTILFCLLCLTALIRDINATRATSPNILMLMFDDLGFNDVGYNGGVYPTPVLDQMVETSSIKLNRHYSESICSASRSSFFTGRYSWKSGMNTNAFSLTDMHFNRDSVLFPELLQSNGYKTFIAGKWHIGYTNKDLLPPSRGFDEGLYTHVPMQYYTRGVFKPFNRYWGQYPTNDEQIWADLTAAFPKGLPIHDTYHFNTKQGIAERPIYHSNNEYCETIYTRHIIGFIEKQTNANPFYIQYNLYTPHSMMVEPPPVDPQFQYQYDTVCNNILQEHPGKQLFCRSMLYAQERITEIIQKLKDSGLYENTLIVVVSDNGPTSDEHHSYGSTLPLRGTKTGVHDGSLRTPSFLSGGFIDTLLDGARYEYDDLVHISDWYNILTDIAGINTDTHSDIDHRDLQIWDQILCSVTAEEDTCDRFHKRTELLQMRICGDETRYDLLTNSEKQFYGTMIIQNEWKLVINGSIAVTEGCPVTSSDLGLVHRNTYRGYDKLWYATPNQTFYDLWYRESEKQLFESQCLEELDGNKELINDPNYAPFQFDEFMLFNIETDKTECCNIAAENQQKVQELFGILQQRSLEYNVPQRTPPNIGALWVQINSYDCETGMTYLKPWDASYPDKCGLTELTMHDMEKRNCASIWKRLLEIKNKCDGNVNANEGMSYDRYRCKVFGLGIIVVMICKLVVSVVEYRKKKIFVAKDTMLLETSPLLI